MPPFPLSTVVGRPYGTTAGYRQTKSVQNPLAGAAVSLSVKGGEIWRIVSVRTLLVTSAALGNRFFIATLTDGSGKIVWETVEPTAQAPSIPVAYTLSPSLSGYPAVTAARAGLPLPDVFLEAGYTLTLSAVNLDVADQFSQFAALVEVYPIGEGYLPSGAT